MNILYLLIGLGVGGGVGFWLGKMSKKTVGGLSNIEKVNQKRKEEVEKTKGEILEMLAEKNEITNDEVEKALGVSDATATNYLQELENEGKLEQVGKEGRFVHYRLKT